MLNGLDLFSGIGGMSIALQEWCRPICYCEIDPYCQGVLLSRMESGELPRARIWDNIETFQTNWFTDQTIDIMYGGFPCQDVSTAGNGKGLEGKRSGLFFEIVRLAKEIKPPFIFIENVPAISTRGGIQIVTSLTEMGYDCRWCVISASEIGAVHRRQRFFLLAHTNSESSGQADQISKSKPNKEETRIRSARQDRRNISFVCWDEGKCPSLAMDNGFPYELEQARALGNAVVPKQAREAFKILMGLK